MTREIKFRAWDKKENKMFYFDFNSLSGWDDGNVYIDSQSAPSISDKSLEIMQYTGFEDKNGVEIYEGDILAPVEVKIKEHNNLKCVVTWGGKGWHDLKDNKKDGEYCLTKYNANIWKVIGNIYQDKELIK